MLFSVAIARICDSMYYRCNLSYCCSGRVACAIQHCILALTPGLVRPSLISSICTQRGRDDAIISIAVANAILRKLLLQSMPWHQPMQ